MCSVACILEVRRLLWIGRGVGKESDSPRHKETLLRCFFQSLGEGGLGEHRGRVAESKSGKAVEGFVALRVLHISNPLSPSFLSSAGLAVLVCTPGDQT